MTRIHDDEADTGVPVVRSLLRRDLRARAEEPLRALSASGTDHAMYRLGSDLVVRVPRTPAAAESLGRELEHLEALARVLPVAVPEVVHHGEPAEGYPHAWAVLRWVAGRDGWQAREDVADPHGDALAADLAAVVTALRAATLPGVPRRGSGQRGGPLAGVLDRAHRWVDGGGGAVPEDVDVHAVRDVLRELPDAADDAVPYVLTHGDLIPGNIVLRAHRLAAVIDWGYVSAADPALDLVPAWAVLGPRARAGFHDELAPDDATWQRARANALEQALGAVVYYTPRRHPLADVMRRTLTRILDDRP